MRSPANAAALTALLLPSSAHAWGDDGHRVVGQLAWDALTPQARVCVADLLPPDAYGTLADAATWADVYARTDPTYAWANRLHYIGTPQGSAAVTVTDTTCPDDGVHGPGCVVGAIGTYTARLADPSLSHDEHVEALRFLAHFVGDLHMPLHVGHPDGRGGTLTNVVYRHAEPQPIHMVWDVALPASILRSLGGVSPRWQDLSNALEADLRGRGDAVDAWSPSLSPDDLGGSVVTAALGWANESYALARRPDLFGFADGATLPRRYDRLAQPVVRERLEQAGVRLAAVLNAACR